MKIWFVSDLSHYLLLPGSSCAGSSQSGVAAGSVLGAHPWGVGAPGACKQTLWARSSWTACRLFWPSTKPFLLPSSGCDCVPGIGAVLRGSALRARRQPLLAYCSR